MSSKFSALSDLSDINRVSGQYEEANGYARALRDLAKKEKNNVELTRSYMLMGVIANNQDDFELTQMYLDSTSYIAEKHQGDLTEAFKNYLQAYFHKSIQNYELAIQSAQAALDDLQTFPDENFMKAKTHYVLYSIYSAWNDTRNTYEYARNTVEAAIKSENKNMLSNAYSALAVAYTYKYNESGDVADRDLVLETIEKAVALDRQYPNQVGVLTNAIARLNLANYLLEYYPEITTEVKRKITDNVGAVIGSSNELKSSGQTLIASSFGILSVLAVNENDINQAESYLLNAYSILPAEDPGNYHTMINVVRNLADLYRRKGDYQKAFEFQQKTTEYSNLLFNESQAEVSKRLEAQYQFQKKESEMQALIEKNEAYTRERLYYIALVALGLVGIFFMFRSYHFRLRYSLEREKQLDAEKTEAELQVQLEKEGQARLKAEQELLTLQQLKLQDEVMANQLHLEHKNKILNELKEKLGGNDEVNIQQIIREESMLDNDFEKTKFRIQELHPNFFKNLSEKAIQPLSPLDFKYCGYMYLGMDTKQIANLLNVEPKSVRMAKYRLKKKLGVDNQTNLVPYLQQMVN